MKKILSCLRLWLAAAALGGIAVAATAAEVVEKSIDSEAGKFRIVRLASGLHHPWAVARLPDGRFLISERRGRVALVENGKVRYLAGAPEVSAIGQGGLLDLVLHPQYGDGAHDWIYMTYSKPGKEVGEDGTATALARARLKGNALTNFEVLFVQDRYSQPGRHYGSRLAWRRDGTLMMTVGERGVSPERAQDKRDHAGSVLRLTDTGSAPADNPFVGDEGALDEIYSYGNRNIQGLVVAGDDRVWASEHAAATGDELNLIQAGQNYGWPVVSRSNDYSTNEPIGVESKPGVRDAQFIYAGRFAPSGLAQVDSQYFPAWRGNLLAGGLASGKLERLVLNGGDVTHSETLLQGQIGRIRDVRQGADGYIYLLNDSGDAGIYRLEPIN